MPRANVGLMLVTAGAALALAGLLVWSGLLGWFGRLPGDLRIEKPSARVYVPITSMLLLSVLVSAVIALVRAFLSRGR